MEERAAFYFTKGLADSSQKTYKSGENRYLRFCQSANWTPLPAPEATLCKFVSFLASEGLKHRTIKTYLSGVRFLHIRSGFPDPFTSHLPRLGYTLKGVKRVEAERGGGQRTRLPITPPLLRRLKCVWERSDVGHDTKMIWAACCTAFFGFLRAGEMTVPDTEAYDKSVHLGIDDIAIDNPSSPSFVRVRIKQSKTDPFRRGVNLFLGPTRTDLCPVAAILSYIVVRGVGLGPLFRFADGRPLTRSRFVAQVRAALTTAGIEEGSYCSHSFRIGAATTAAARGIEDSVIKTLGRWESTAYLQYVRIPREQLTGYSSVLGASG